MAKEGTPKLDAMRRQREEEWARKTGGKIGPLTPTAAREAGGPTAAPRPKAKIKSRGFAKRPPRDEPTSKPKTAAKPSTGGGSSGTSGREGECQKCGKIVAVKDGLTVRHGAGPQTTVCLGSKKAPK